MRLARRRWLPLVIACGLALPLVTSGRAWAQITSICQSGGSYPTQSIDLNGQANAEIVATNAFGIAGGGGGILCLDVTTTSSATATAGDFTVASNSSGRAGREVLNYPNILRGQSYGEATSKSGLPIQVKQINSWPTGWDVQTPPASPGSTTEKWNNAIEFWLTTNKPTGNVGQADGAELMIWLGHSGGLNPAGSPLPTSTDASNVQANIGGMLWNVIGGRASWGSGPQYWNYIAYVPADDVNRTGIHTDFKAFFDDAKTRTGDCRTGPGAVGSGDPVPHGFCVHDEWWVSSVQAGFSIAFGGVGLKSLSFTSTPNGVSTDRTGSDGRPIVNWSLPFDVTQAGCPEGGGSATYAVYMPPGNTPAVQSGSMTFDAVSNTFKATINPVMRNHNDAQLQIALTCPSSGTSTTTESFYVDQSSVVTNSNNGLPIPGATVTLFDAQVAAGPFSVVPNGSAIMLPINRRNPDLTNSTGNFGWDLQLELYYKVRAQKEGCTSPTDPGIPYAESIVRLVPPALINLNIQLSCPIQPVSVVNFTDWGNGYCANVFVTNNTGAPWVWSATFPIDGTIYDIWNATYTRSDGSVTLQGIAWNRTLAPGATTQSVGFCVNRSAPPPGTPAVLVTKTTDWGSGYCSTVTVTNNTSSRMTWSVTIPVQGTIYTAWNGVFTPLGGGQVSVRGVSWNAALGPGEKTHDVGFCANR